MRLPLLELKNIWFAKISMVDFDRSLHLILVRLSFGQLELERIKY